MAPCNRSLAHRMAILILAGAGLVLLLVQGFSYFVQRRRVLADAIQAGDTLAQSVANRMEASFGRAAAVVQQTALILAEREMGTRETAELIRRTLDAQPSLFGMAVALSETAASRSDFFTLYQWRGGEPITVRDRKTATADYQGDWFYLPYYLKTPVWTEPYYDPDARTLMVSYSVPILQADEVIAVVTCDLSLAGIRSLLAALPVGEGGTGVLLSRRGTFIAHPEHPALEMRETIFSLAEAQANREVGQTLARLGRNMLSGVPGHLRYRRPFGADLPVAHMYYATVPSTGWAFGIIRPEAQVLAPLMRLNEISAMIGLAGLALLLIPALGIAWSVAGPLRRLAAAAHLLATGDFDTALPAISSGDEVARLAAAFEQMRHALRRYIADLTTTTAAKERIAGELSAAREIQMGIVPKLFPPFPTRPDIDLYALLIPAREVGGDLYDFMLLDDDHLYLAIGDVSGKGVPASLLMAVGKTLLKSTMQTVRAPARALAHVNQELAEDNEACMFITMFCGILNLRSGDLIYANAGHNPPFLAHRSGSVDRLDAPPGPALGAICGSTYQDRSIRLSAEDLLLLYTDGVTEAMNPANVMFAEEGLLDYIGRAGIQAAKPFLDGLARAVHTHAAGAEQSDDITALAVRYRVSVSAVATSPRPAAPAVRTPDATLRLRNHLEELSRLAAWIESEGATLGLPPPLTLNLNLALEEWIVNVVSYAYVDAAEHTIDLRLWRDGNELRLEIEDDGKPFDPTAQAEADTSLPIEHRQIGGLGIHFIRKTMDRFTYRRDNGRNLVTWVKTITGPPA